jgi:hypothetical protein
MNDPLGKAERACIVRHDEHGNLTTGTVNSSTVLAVLSKSRRGEVAATRKLRAMRRQTNT